MTQNTENFTLISQRSNFLRTTNPYRLSGSCSKERLPETSDIRCRFLARGKRTTIRAESNQSCPWNRNLWRRNGNTGETELTGQGSKYEGEKRENDWLVGCSRRSNFQNGSSSIKQVLLSLVQPEKPTEPNSSRNVQRIPPWAAGKIVSPPSFFPCRGSESRSAIPTIPEGFARLSSILRVCYYPVRPDDTGFPNGRNPPVFLLSCRVEIFIKAQYFLL